MMKEPTYLKVEVHAVKAWHEGKADARQQNIVKNLIIEKLCQIYAQSFDPDNPRVTDFNEGKRWVANQLRDLITLPIDRLVKKEGENDRRPTKLTDARSGKPAAKRSRGAKRA